MKKFKIEYKINIVSYTEEIGLIIESKNIFEALESIFNVMWKNLD